MGFICGARRQGEYQAEQARWRDGTIHGRNELEAGTFHIYLSRYWCSNPKGLVRHQISEPVVEDLEKRRVTRTAQNSFLLSWRFSNGTLSLVVRIPTRIPTQTPASLLALRLLTLCGRGCMVIGRVNFTLRIACDAKSMCLPHASWPLFGGFNVLTSPADQNVDNAAMRCRMSPVNAI